MKSVIASLIAVAGMSVAANAQVSTLKMLVSTDGVNFSSSATVGLGAHIDVLVTASINDPTGLVAFGSANFQPVVTGWNPTDGFNVGAASSGNQVGGMVNAQATAAIAGSGTNPYTHQTVHTAVISSVARDNGTPYVPAGAYAANTYGRVLPMGRTALSGANAITGFVQTIPAQTDQTGRNWAAGTYLRIAQSNIPDWFNAATNNSGGSGVNVAQLTRNGRAVDTVAGDGHHTVDPDFWGTRDLIYKPPATGIGSNSWPASQSFDNGRTDRLVDVQLFRFRIDIGSGHVDGDQMLVDAPMAGQQLTSDGTARYMGWYQTDGENAPTGIIPFGDVSGGFGAQLQSALITISVPTPASLALLGLGGLVIGRRRR